MTSPFFNTNAQGSEETIEGGSCFIFDKNLESLSIDPGIDSMSVNCFSSKPIITNDIPDYPFPSPPPVTTGCYPLRATASTTVDPDSPEGLTVSVTNNDPSCFPLIDIKLNTQPILDQVLALIAPSVTFMGGGGGGTILNTHPYGCCCDSTGRSFKGTTCCQGSEPCYTGLMSDCIGADLLHDVSRPGISWDNHVEKGNDPPECCTNNNPSMNCCTRAQAKWWQPRVLGIAEIASTIDENTAPIGDPYIVALQSAGDGWDADLVIDGVENLMELGSPSTKGLCTNDPPRYMPGVNNTDEVPAIYPGDFQPQRVCAGSMVTLYAQDASAVGGWAGGLPSDFNPLDASCAEFELYVWFQQALAHDATCEASSGEPLSAGEYYRSLQDPTPRLTPDQKRALSGVDFSQPPYRGKKPPQPRPGGG